MTRHENYARTVQQADEYLSGLDTLPSFTSALKSFSSSKSAGQYNANIIDAARSMAQNFLATKNKLGAVHVDLTRITAEDLSERDVHALTVLGAYLSRQAAKNDTKSWDDVNKQYVRTTLLPLIDQIAGKATKNLGLEDVVEQPQAPQRPEAPSLNTTPSAAQPYKGQVVLSTPDMSGFASIVMLPSARQPYVADGTTAFGQFGFSNAMPSVPQTTAGTPATTQVPQAPTQVPQTPQGQPSQAQSSESQYTQQGQRVRSPRHPEGTTGERRGMEATTPERISAYAQRSRLTEADRYGQDGRNARNPAGFGRIPVYHRKSKSRFGWLPYAAVAAGLIGLGALGSKAYDWYAGRNTATTAATTVISSSSTTSSQNTNNNAVNDTTNQAAVAGETPVAYQSPSESPSSVDVISVDELNKKFGHLIPENASKVLVERAVRGKQQGAKVTAPYALTLPGDTTDTEASAAFHPDWFTQARDYVATNPQEAVAVVARWVNDAMPATVMYATGSLDKKISTVNANANPSGVRYPIAAMHARDIPRFNGTTPAELRTYLETHVAGSQDWMMDGTKGMLLEEKLKENMAGLTTAVDDRYFEAVVFPRFLESSGSAVDIRSLPPTASAALDFGDALETGIGFELDKYAAIIAQLGSPTPLISVAKQSNGMYTHPLLETVNAQVIIAGTPQQVITKVNDHNTIVLEGKAGPITK